MPKSVLGQFEHHVLLVILQLDREAYSVQIVLEMEARTGREVATSAVFVALQRLKKKGMLIDRMARPGPEGGHARRYFRLTPAALAVMREARKEYLRLWDGMEAVLDETRG